MKSDKELERKRYNKRANQSLKDKKFFNINQLALFLRTPYDFYQSLIIGRLKSKSKVLEIGAGMGENTGFLLTTDAEVYAIDISKESLNVLCERFDSDRLVTKVADMEQLPFCNELFDVVMSAGSLSYGDHNAVLNEIHRVLRPGGVFVAVDSLNNSPIYRFNRYLHYLRGGRSLNVIKRVPDLDLLHKYDIKFSRSKTWFFGSISYLTPLLNILFGEKLTAKISDRVDRFIKVKRSAFKFVMIVEK